MPRLVRGCGSAPTARFALYEIAIILPRAFVPGRRAQAFFSFDSDPRTVSSPVQASPVRSVRLCCSKTSYAHVKKCTVRLGDIPPIGGATSPERLVPVYTVFAGQDGAGLRSTRTSKSTARPCFATPACFVSKGSNPTPPSLRASATLHSAYCAPLRRMPHGSTTTCLGGFGAVAPPGTPTSRPAKHSMVHARQSLVQVRNKLLRIRATEQISPLWTEGTNSIYVCNDLFVVAYCLGVIGRK